MSDSSILRGGRPFNFELPSFTLGAYTHWHDHITMGLVFTALITIPQIFLASCFIGFVIELTHKKYPIFENSAEYISNVNCVSSGCADVLTWIFRLQVDPVQKTVMAIMMIYEHLIHFHGAYPITVGWIGILCAQRGFIWLNVPPPLCPLCEEEA